MLKAQLLPLQRLSLDARPVRQDLGIKTDLLHSSLALIGATKTPCEVVVVVVVVPGVVVATVVVPDPVVAPVVDTPEPVARELERSNT